METKILMRANDGQYSIRKADNKTYIDFYAAVFNVKSKLIREWGEVFFEIIHPAAFAGVLADPGLNTIATIDHEREKMIGRVKSGTLTMKTDAKGLLCSVEVPDTTRGRDLVVMIERGDYFECSFIYTIAENGVTYDRGEEIPVRTIMNIARLIDVSIVIDGAFPTTDILKRYLSDEPTTPPAKTEKPKTRAELQHDILRKKIDILKF